MNQIEDKGMTANIRIKIFRAIEYPELSKRVFDAHNDRLRELNISITSTSGEWLQLPGTICMCAIHEESDTILGSSRIQIFDGENPLPMQNAIAPFDESIHNYVQKYADQDLVSEGCGLWCVKNEMVSELNLSRKLYILINAICKYENIRYCLGLAPKHTLRTVMNAGYKISSALSSPFSYPSERFSTYVVESDTFDIESADPETSKYISKINENPNLIEHLQVGTNTYRLVHEYLL